jgi:hypothetical protein
MHAATPSPRSPKKCLCLEVNFLFAGQAANDQSIAIRSAQRIKVSEEGVPDMELTPTRYDQRECEGVANRNSILTLMFSAQSKTSASRDRSRLAPIGSSLGLSLMLLVAPERVCSLARVRGLSSFEDPRSVWSQEQVHVSPQVDQVSLRLHHRRLSRQQPESQPVLAV